MSQKLRFCDLIYYSELPTITNVCTGNTDYTCVSQIFAALISYSYIGMIRVNSTLFDVCSEPGSEYKLQCCEASHTKKI